jgi:hypothetical protein
MWTISKVGNGYVVTVDGKNNGLIVQREGNQITFSQPAAGINGSLTLVGDEMTGQLSVTRPIRFTRAG